MKTTLEIDETVMRELKARAARDGRTMSELVEMALRALLAEKPKQVALPPLPVFDLGGWAAQVETGEQREALLDEREDGVVLPGPVPRRGSR